MTHDSDISPLTRLVARLDAVAALHSAAAPASAATPAAVRALGMVPTHFPSIDRALAGGLRLGDLAVVGGDDSSGVSSLLLAIALRASPRALLLSTELSVDRVYERALAMAARVPVESVRLGAIGGEERTRLAAAATILRDHAPMVETLLDGEVAALERVVASTPTQLVIVDALEGLLDAPTGHDERLAWAVLALKRLALRHGLVVLLGCHLPGLTGTRHDRRPTLADFGRGGAVGAHADAVLGLYREELYEQDLGVSGAAELRILKHRDGARGYVDLYFDARCGRFEDMAEA